MKQFLKKHTLILSFLTIFIALFFFLGYNQVLDLGPSSVHAWRQSDSYSFALTYFYENHKLLEPSMLFIGEKGQGRAVSEFPVLYYATAKIWKITGVTSAVLKFINFLFLLIGLFYLTRLSKKILKDNFWAMVVVLILFSSPLLGYYSFNFIPNIPAFGLALSGLYFIYLFATTEKNRYLILFTIIFTFASLLKVTALFSFFGGLTILCSFFLEDIKRYKFQLMKVFISTLIILGIYWIWYSFSVNYNNANFRGFFNQSSMPIWKLEPDNIKEIGYKFYHNVFPQYFNRIAIFFVIGSALTIFALRKKVNRYARRATIIYLLGTIAFVALFFRGLNKHDYFLINTLIFIPVVTIAILHTIKEKLPDIFSSVYFKIIVGIIVSLLINHNMILTRSHYNPHNKLVKYNIPLTKRQTDFWDYNHHVAKYYDYQFHGIHKYLREIGINYNSTVITIGDYTPNKTLSLMHLRGFPEYHYSLNYNDEEMIKRMKELGASYLIVCGNKDLKREYLSKYTYNLIGQHNDVRIFKIVD